MSDARNPGYQKFRGRAEKASQRALELAEAGVPPAGGLAIEENDPLARGRRILKDRCQGCHVYQGEGERRAPDLDGWSSRPWLRAFLKAPEDERFYGKTKVRGMKPVKAEGPDLDALVEWIYSQGGDAFDAKLAARGKEVFDLSGCDNCHDLDGKSGADGPPNLGARAGVEWIHDFLVDPSEGRFFDGKNQMPKFRGKLGEEDLSALATLLRAERAR